MSAKTTEPMLAHIEFLKNTDLDQFIKENKGSYYKIFNLEAKCEGNEIKTSYKQLMKLVHPDIAQKEHLLSQDNFEAIVKAYKTLSDETQRKRYDEEQNKQKYFYAFLFTLSTGFLSTYLLIPYLRKRNRGNSIASDIWHN